MTGIKGAVNAAPDPSEVVSIPDAAAECGVTVGTFIGWMVESGMLLEHPNGGYIPSPHPDIRPLGERR
jgi:hypothetical protein